MHTDSRDVAGWASRPCRSPTRAVSSSGGLVLKDSDDVISVTAGGQVTRSLVAGVPVKGRDTMGVSFVKFKGDDRVVTIARNAELPADETSTEEPSTDEEQSE